MPSDLKNVIVGSGPSAYICASELIRNGQECTIITPSLIQHTILGKVERSDRSKKLFLKDRFSKTWVYKDLGSRFKIRGQSTDIMETAAFGGLSNIWGAVSFPPLGIQTFLPFLTSNEIKDLLSELKGILRINTVDSEFWSVNYLEIPQRKYFLEDSHPSLARSLGGSAWDLQDEWKKLDKNYITFVEGFVIKVSNSFDGSLVLNLEDSKKINKEIRCKRVFFACGPFGNARTILNSCPELGSIEIEDSSIKYKIFLDVFLRNRFENSMEPKKLFLHSSSGVTDENEYLQVYNLSWQLIQSFRFKSLHSILKFVSRILAPVVSVGIVFQSGSASPSITLAKTESGWLESQISKSKKARIRECRFNWELMRSGLIPLPFSIKGKPGAGVHSGAYLTDNYSKINNALSQNQIHEKNGVYFLGTSNISGIPAGPVTLLGLIQTLATSRRACEIE